MSPERLAIKRAYKEKYMRLRKAKRSLTGFKKCRNKIKYSNQIEAKDALAVIKATRITSNKLMAYDCWFCNNWHLGNKLTDDELKDKYSKSEGRFV